MKQTARPEVFSLSTWTWLTSVNFKLFDVFPPKTRWTERSILFGKNLLISGFASKQNGQKFWNLFETLKHEYMERYILQTFQFFSSVHFFAEPKKNCYHFGMRFFGTPLNLNVTLRVQCILHIKLTSRYFNTLVIYF